MKNRYKKAKRILKFYQTHFGYKPPYHVLVCGTFCKQALTDKINIAEQLPKYLSGEIRLQTTKCAVKECELGGSLLFGPYKVLKQYDQVDCHHTWFKGSAKCLIKTMSKNECKFILATQDGKLTRKAREEHIPVMHIAFNCINLEDPPQVSLNVAKTKTLETIAVSEKQDKNIAKLRQEMGLAPETTEVKKKKKKKGGPNPLSVKKKKKKPQYDNGLIAGGVVKAKRRKKKKVKIADHVKQALFGQ